MLMLICIFELTSKYRLNIEFIHVWKKIWKTEMNDKILWTRIAKVMRINCKVFFFNVRIPCVISWKIHTQTYTCVVINHKFYYQHFIQPNSIDDICFESNVLIIFKFQRKINSALFNKTPYDRKLRKNNEIYIAILKCNFK